MEVTFSSDSFASAAQALQSVVNANTTLPILQNVLIEATEDGNVTLFASDLESYAKATIAADVKTPGRATVPAKVLADITKGLPGAPAVFRSEGSKARLDCDKVHYQLATMPAEEFPEWPAFEPLTTLEIAQADLRDALAKALVAVPTRDPRKVLLGVYFDLGEEGLRLVGTDGKKLVVAAVSNYQAKGDGKRGVIAPHKVATELQRHLDEAGTVRVQLGERQIAFDNGRLLYVSNVIEGQYPQYNMVVPKDFAYAVKAPRETLALDIKRASAVQDKQESRVVLAFEKGKLNVSSFATEVGAYDSSMEIDFDQPPIKVCFNFNYLNDMLKTIGGDEVVFHMNKPATPVVLRTPGHPDNTYLLMPIKLTEYSMEEPAPAEDDADDEPDDDDGEMEDEYADDEAEAEESYS